MRHHIGNNYLETFARLLVFEQTWVRAVVPGVLAGITNNWNPVWSVYRWGENIIMLYLVQHDCRFSILSSFQYTKSPWWSSCLVCNTCKERLNVVKTPYFPLTNTDSPSDRGSQTLAQASPRCAPCPDQWESELRYIWTIRAGLTWLKPDRF